MINKKKKQRIIQRYNELVTIKGFNASGMGWKNEELLHDRYRIFMKYLNFTNLKILDYGCGIGSLYFYIKKNKIKFKKYYANDVNETFLNELRKKVKSKKLSVINYKNLRKSKLDTFDISIANGVHNFNTKNHFNDFVNDLFFLYKISKIGMGISFINDNVDYREKYLSYKSLSKITKIIEKKKIPFIIDQRLNKYETFLFLYKKN